MRTGQALFRQSLNKSEVVVRAQLYVDDLAVVAHMCDRLIVMQHGLAVEELTRAALGAHQAHPSLHRRASLWFTPDFERQYTVTPQSVHSQVEVTTKSGRSQAIGRARVRCGGLRFSGAVMRWVYDF